MLRTRTLGVLLTMLGCSALGCSRGEANPPTTTPSTAGTGSPGDDAARISRRCSERWTKAVAGDWIEAYDYLAPSVRKDQTLSDYIMGKKRHRYEKPETPQVLETRGDHAFVYVACTWTPVDPTLDKIKLDPGQSLTERLELVETWYKSGGEWYYFDAKSAQEFYKLNPAVPQPKAAVPSSGASGGQRANSR